MSSCTCPQSDLLLAFHQALPLPLLLRVQFHRLLCPICRERYQKLSEVSGILAAALTSRAVPARPRAPMPLWAAALLCVLALSAAGWAARIYLVPPVDTRSTDSSLLSTQKCDLEK
jgi:hypothetical protein